MPNSQDGCQTNSRRYDSFTTGPVWLAIPSNSWVLVLQIDKNLPPLQPPPFRLTAVLGEAGSTICPLDFISHLGFLPPLVSEEIRRFSQVTCRYERMFLWACCLSFHRTDDVGVLQETRTVEKTTGYSLASCFCHNYMYVLVDSWREGIAPSMLTVWLKYPRNEHAVG